jgi:hypothetical protein
MINARNRLMTVPGILLCISILMRDVIELSLKKTCKEESHEKNPAVLLAAVYSGRYTDLLRNGRRGSVHRFL